MREKRIIKGMELRYGQINWYCINKNMRYHYLEELEQKNNRLYLDNAEPVLANSLSNEVIFKVRDGYVVISMQRQGDGYICPIRDSRTVPAVSYRHLKKPMLKPYLKRTLRVISDIRPARVSGLERWRRLAWGIVLLDNIALFPFLLLFFDGIEFFASGFCIIQSAVFVYFGNWILTAAVVFTTLSVVGYAVEAWLNSDYDIKIFIGYILYLTEIQAFLYWNRVGFLPV